MVIAFPNGFNDMVAFLYRHIFCSELLWGEVKAPTHPIIGILIVIPEIFTERLVSVVLGGLAKCPLWVQL